MRIDFTKPSPGTIYVRPNGIDAPYEIIDGVDFEVMHYYISREQAVRAALGIARLSRFMVYEANRYDVIVGSWNLKRHEQTYPFSNYLHT